MKTHDSHLMFEEFIDYNLWKNSIYPMKIICGTWKRDCNYIPTHTITFNPNGLFYDSTIKRKEKFGIEKDIIYWIYGEYKKINLYHINYINNERAKIISILPNCTQIEQDWIKICDSFML